VRQRLESGQGDGIQSKQQGVSMNMTEGTSFWGHKGLQRRFGKVDGVKVYRRRGSP